jgi:hypothetical protein
MFRLSAESSYRISANFNITGSCNQPILLNFPNLVVILLLRTLIALPVIAAMTYWVVF